MRSKYIEKELYLKILEVMPISCVDVVILCGNATLLALRKKSPAKGAWFFPGGRVLKGERLEAAAARKTFEEVGIVVPKNKFKFLITKETIFRTRFGIVHTINSVFVCKLLRKPEIILDEEQLSGYVWMKKNNFRLQKYVLDIIKLCKS
jgi:colanic acid biosynthesis protein WcaH